MTQKDAVQTELNFLNIVIANVILGGMIGLSIYNIQSSSINVISIIGAILMLGAVAVVLRWKYDKLLRELKDLP